MRWSRLFTSPPVVHVPFSGGVTTALLVFGFGLLGICLVAVIIDAVAPFFGAVSNRRLASAIAAYASTPIWLATVFVPFPTLWAPLQVLAVSYHTWLLYLGLRLLMKAARDRVLGYATTVVLCTILLEIVFAIVSTALGGATHLNPYRVVLGSTITAAVQHRDFRIASTGMIRPDSSDITPSLRGLQAGSNAHPGVQTRAPHGRVGNMPGVSRSGAGHPRIWLVASRIVDYPSAYRTWEAEHDRLLRGVEPHASRFADGRAASGHVYADSPQSTVSNIFVSGR